MRLSTRLCSSVADSRIVFTKLFDEVCQQFNITVPAAEGYSSSDIPHETTERWSNNYGGSGGNGGGNGGGNYGSGGGGWRGGAASNIVTDTLLGWTLGGVACVIALNIMV